MKVYCIISIVIASFHDVSVAKRIQLQSSGVMESTSTFVADVYSVTEDQTDLTFPGQHGHVSRGLSFSGGGSRALSLTMGAYRALDDLGLMRNVDGVSSTSGGTWASSIYMFSDMSISQMLGKPTTPEKLTMSALSEEFGAMGETVGTTCVDDIVSPFFNGDVAGQAVAWENMIAKKILSPFGLDARDTYMAGSPEQLARIRESNPQLSDAKFLLPQASRPPVFIMNGVIAEPVGTATEDFVSLQISPDFTGSPMSPTSEGSELKFNYNGSDFVDLRLGGGVIETFAFGGDAPSDQGPGRKEVPAPDKPLALATAVAISSDLVIFLDRKIWPILTDGTHQAAREFELGDGGFDDFNAIYSLVQRKAKKVAVWINTVMPLSTTIDFCNPSPDLDLDKTFINWDHADLSLAAMFGYKFYDAKKGFEDGEDVKGVLESNTRMNLGIFERKEFVPLLCEFQQLRKAGKAMVALKTYHVQKNEWFGIRGGYDMKILFVLNSPSAEFEARLPEDTKAALDPTVAAQNDLFVGFPFFSTQLHNDPCFFKRAEVNLLAAQSEFIVRQNEALFREILSDDDLPPKGIWSRVTGWIRRIWNRD